MFTILPPEHGGGYKDGDEGRSSISKGISITTGECKVVLLKHNKYTKYNVTVCFSIKMTGDSF